MGIACPKRRAGRVIRLPIGLGYAVINTALPNTLWTKASALVSAMWGVGTLIGPAAGGLFVLKCQSDPPAHDGRANIP